jgi:hypothetical protein
MSHAISRVAFSLAWLGIGVALLTLLMSIASVRAKLRAERHFAETVRERNRMNRNGFV